MKAKTAGYINDLGERTRCVIPAKGDAEIEVYLRLSREDASALTVVSELFGWRPSEAVAWALPAAMKAWSAGLLAEPEEETAPKSN